MNDNTNPQSTGGRKVGAKNLVNSEIKHKIQKVVHKYVTEEGARTLEEDLKVLRPVDRVTLIEKLMKYVLPTLGSVKIEDDNGEPVTINVRWKKTEPKKDDEDDSDLDYSEEV